MGANCVAAKPIKNIYDAAETAKPGQDIIGIRAETSSWQWCNAQLLRTGKYAGSFGKKKPWAAQKCKAMEAATVVLVGVVIITTSTIVTLAAAASGETISHSDGPAGIIRMLREKKWLALRRIVGRKRRPTPLQLRVLSQSPSRTRRIPSKLRLNLLFKLI